MMSGPLHGTNGTKLPSEQEELAYVLDQNRRKYPHANLANVSHRNLLYHSSTACSFVAALSCEIRKEARRYSTASFTTVNPKFGLHIGIYQSLFDSLGTKISFFLEVIFYSISCCFYHFLVPGFCTGGVSSVGQ